MTTRVELTRLRQFIEAAFRAAGYEEQDVQHGTNAFLLQEMRGVQTHALRRLHGMLDDVASGRIRTQPNRRTVREHGAIKVIDGDFGLGITSCMEAMDVAISLSKQFGIGFCVVVNSNHFLAAAPYCIHAAEAGAIGMIFANGMSGMAYPGTHVGALGNSPSGYGVPTGAGFPLVFDAALTLSGGKLVQWTKEGKTEVPAGFLGYDAQGNYTTDPNVIRAGGVPLPIGMHKGAGLGILIDVISGVIAGSSFLRTLIPQQHPDWRRSTDTHTCIAIDIETFMPLREFEERMSAYVADIKDKPLAPGYDEILLPGERAARTIADAQANGVAIEDEVVERMEGISKQYGVALPW
jgi:LDH2 family malate/lactate/ureidoglycolate dehydrogenase